MPSELAIGFGRQDITPRVGVEMQGYGDYLNRACDGIRDRLYARAMACRLGDVRVVLVSCDLPEVDAGITAIVRDLVAAGGGPGPTGVMVHATHTHSGPAMCRFDGHGTADPVYREIAPRRIARACLAALADCRPAALAYAEAPCPGLAINREYDAFRAPLDDALREDWQAAKPELTDPTCRVLTITRDGVLAGFLSFFSCHPVIGGPDNRKIHGDYCGVATNWMERLHPGTTGLFLQGSLGDINTAATALGEADTMRAIDALGQRYARAIGAGITAARPLEIDCLRTVQHRVRFSRKPTDRATLVALIAEQEAILHAPDASDADPAVRLATVKAVALRDLRARLDRGEDLAPADELHGLRLGPLSLLGTPFQIQTAITRGFLGQARSPIPLVLGMTDGTMGYAVDRTMAERGGYAADMVPFKYGQLPFADIHDELVQALVALDCDLQRQTG